MRFYSCNPRIIALYLVKVSIKMDPDVTQIYAPRTLKYIFMIVCYTGFKRYNTCISISWIETASVYSMFLPDKSCRQVALTCIISLLFKNSLLFKLLSTCKPRKKKLTRNPVSRRVTCHVPKRNPEPSCLKLTYSVSKSRWRPGSVVYSL